MEPLANRSLDPIIIAGPTASGKGQLAFELARRIGGEVVSLDSMKIYREMDIATAKPPLARRALVRYHLLDQLDPHEESSLGSFLPLCDAALADIRRRERPAIVAGGTALYLKAFLFGLQAGAPADWSARARYSAYAQQKGVEALHALLRERDPSAAERIHPQDTRRIVRALEVLDVSGRPQSQAWTWEARAPVRAVRGLFGIARERAELYARIDRRVTRMVEEGLIEEALRLRRRVPPLGRSASQVIGYKEILEGLEQGWSRERTVEAIQQRTRRFAKSQLTWLRKLPVTWLETHPDEPIERLVDGLLERLPG